MAGNTPFTEHKFSKSHLGPETRQGLSWSLFSHYSQRSMSWLWIPTVLPPGSFPCTCYLFSGNSGSALAYVIGSESVSLWLSIPVCSNELDMVEPLSSWLSSLAPGLLSKYWVVWFYVFNVQPLQTGVGALCQRTCEAKRQIPVTFLKRQFRHPRHPSYTQILSQLYTHTRSHYTHTQILHTHTCTDSHTLTNIHRLIQ